MLIRKNTKEHYAILQTLKKYSKNAERKKLVKVFVVEAGKNLDQRIPVELTGAYADLYYELNYEAILKNLKDDEHQLHKEGENEDLYYFESRYTPAETPFMLADEVQEEVNKIIKDKKLKVRSLKDKEDEEEEQEIKSIKLKPHTETEEVRPKEEPKHPDAEIDEKNEAEQEQEIIKSPEVEIPKLKVVKPPEATEPVDARPTPTEKGVEKAGQRGKKESSYKLKHELNFSNLDKPFVGKYTKAKVINYYNIVAEHMLKFIVSKPLLSHDLEELLEKAGAEKPDWIKTIHIYLEHVSGEFVVANDKEHLLLLVENGIKEISSWSSRVKTLKNPDNLIIKLLTEKKGRELNEVSEVLREILEITELNGYLLKSHHFISLNIPLDSKSNYRVTAQLASLISQLLTRKAGNIFTMDKNEKGKDYLDSTLNATGIPSVAPYSIIESSAGEVAIPLLWEDFEKEELTFDIETVVPKVEQDKAYFDTILSHPFNAENELKKLERRYGFLL